MTLNVSRAIYLNVLLMIGVLDWLNAYLEPEQNIGNWVAAAVGALIIRFRYPDLPVRISIGGWFTGFSIACLFASTVLALPQFVLVKPVAVWGGLALLGDMIVQLFGYIMRLGSKVGDDVVNDTGGVIDSGIDKADRIADIVLKIKNILPDGLLNVFKRKDS